jgi:hypothetical protein
VQWRNYQTRYEAQQEITTRGHTLSKRQESAARIVENPSLKSKSESVPNAPLGNAPLGYVSPDYYERKSLEMKKVA